MTSSYNIPKKYKIYVGRIFILRKHKLIPASTEKKYGKRFLYDATQTFGEAVYILDETNSKVQVTTASGSLLLWIPKYFLHKEITNQHMNNINSITKINELSNELISSNVSKDNKMFIMQILKIYSDTL